MSRETVRHRARVLSASIMFVTVLCLSRPVDCQNEKDFQNPEFDEAAAGQTAAKYQDVVQKSLATITAALKGEIKEQLGFCIIDAEDDWNQSFDFSKNTDFLYECARLTKGDMTLRLCTAAEIKFYIHTFTDALSGAHGQGSKKKSQFVKPNTNCNLTSWVPGCEPGWACSVDSAIVDMKNSKEIPARTANCASCCEGFFCPKGLTCMIPCPLGSYCPLAKLNNKTGLCDPYAYQIPPGKLNHTCGGADAWADIQSSSEVFCTAGSYCQSTIQKIPCSSGHYCRLGSTSQKVEQNGRVKGGNEVGIWKLYDGFVYNQVIFSICCPSITFNGHGVVGRIKHNECWWLATCEPRSANQNIRAYGILLFVGLSILIVIIYGCSDQVLVIREKRKAKSREMAVQSVRENALAREKWKSAKDLARKGAIGLQTQLSRTFSRRKSSRQPETLRSSSQAKPGTDGLPPLPVGSQSQPPSKGNKQEESNLTKMMHEIENNPESPDGFNVEIGDKIIRKQTPKGKQLHTQSQMFRYAYGQIEKEKAMQEQTKNMTFSGVISMANEIEIRKRPTIEVAFKDLTITLKGKNKHLMRSVTGKLSPGRVSAVMGPSGAGKTTFLSALKGRVPGCIMSGTILVNGKAASIQSYKRIIGFVPQDDIVHGNLTVEENLWFSARCRLSADLPKAEKVLVVERVIESLGLQHIRDSLVGTVEKRGISGGQRKRVNVGLEMVMEPSLLILDEPTSGLDSSSSQLLLRALRREALEGVNICTVVHQPSYALFRMFDDLILLAKGGVIVYHGPVKKVEEYFASLGITVPDRINPPDYFIDILEGIVKPSSSSGFDYKELPVKWMLHNGYSVPMDMLQSIEGMSASVAEHLSQEINDDSSEVQSFAGEFWQDIKCNAAHRKDSIQRNFLNLGDLSKRRTPGVFVQYRYFLGRVGKQRLREAKIQVVDYLILLLAGICIGTLAKVSDENFGATGYTHTVIAVSLLCKIAALRSFSLDKLHYWRESASGMSSLAFFLSKDTVDHFNTLIKPLVYLSMFYFFNNPRSSVTDNYLVLACLVYCVTGIAYIMAICFEPGPAQLWSVLLPVVLTLIATNNDNNRFVERISDLSYTKWALEAFVVSNAKSYRGVWLITRCGALYSKGYDLNDFFPGLMRLILAGILSRTIAFFCMITLQKN